MTAMGSACEPEDVEREFAAPVDAGRRPAPHRDRP